MKKRQPLNYLLKNIMTAGQIFLESPMESPNIPTWNRIDTALPSFLSDLKTL